jgi:hypothetical protein
MDWAKPDPTQELDHTPQPVTEEATEQRQRRSNVEVQASPYVKDFNICHMGLWADKSFKVKYGETESIRLMLQRFAVATEIYKTSKIGEHVADFTEGGVGIELRVDSLTVSDFDMSPYDPKGDANSPVSAEDYLSAFSQRDLTCTGANDGKVCETDWSKVCLAHAYTYQDYAGTLGLAWTAYPDAKNFNGGICTSQYRNGEGKDMSLNTGFSSSFNFNSQQPEMQSALVLTHEIGHNMGSPHDGDADQNLEDGVHIMFPYAASGTKPNNEKFSEFSCKSFAAAMTDRAGCFLDASGAGNTCGNFFKDGDEDCDCGGEVCDQFDPSGFCTKDCKFGKNNDDLICKCSPNDAKNGACCNKDTCQDEGGKVCTEMSVCQEAAECNSSGECPDTTNRKDNSICQVGVAVCDDEDGCAGLCKAGECSEHICSAYGMEECPTSGPDDGCIVKCQPSGGVACVALADITDSADTVFGFNGTATTEYRSITTLKAGASCKFSEIENSGICSAEGKCLEANHEENALDNLYLAYSKYLSSFKTWAAEEGPAGLQNFVWLIIGGILGLIVCIGLCYCALLCRNCLAFPTFCFCSLVATLLSV